MSHFEDFTISTDTASGSSDTGRLKAELQADPTIQADPSEVLGASAIPSQDLLRVEFDVEPGQAAKDATASVVSAHDGSPVVYPLFVAAASILTEQKTITGANEWETVGGIVSNISALAPIDSVIGVLNGACNVQYAAGQLPQIRLVEYLSDGSSPVEILSLDLQDTAGQFLSFQVSMPTSARSGLNQYAVEARLNGASSVDLKFLTLSLFR